MSGDVVPLDPTEILKKGELADRLKVSVRSIENLHLLAHNQKLPLGMLAAN